MMPNTISPKIESLSWGKVKTDGKTYKDVKLFPGGSRAWDWNETGTSHSPGIQPADLEELLEHEARVIILSKGINERLQTTREAEKFLENNGCKYFILQTKDAVKKYNKLCESEPVGALIHSTC